MPYSDWPLILILDDDVRRIELLQQRLYRHGYQTETSGVVDLEHRVESKTLLVLAYLPVPANTIVDVPVLALDRTESQSESSAVGSLSSLAGFDVLLDRIDSLIGPGAK